MTPKKNNKTFSNFLRLYFKWVLDPIASFLIRLGLHPNIVTIGGLVGNIVGAILLAMGHISWGGIIILLMGPVDALDGTMARLLGKPTVFGAFVDSVTDRYSELVILGGLFIYYNNQGNTLYCLLVYLAAAGSILVSYVKARAESLDLDADVGILTRAERYLVLAPSLVLNIPYVGLWIVAVLANFTALQRIWNVRKQFYASLSAVETPENQPVVSQQVDSTH